VENLSIKKLRYALEAAGHGASGSPRHTFLRAHGTKKHRRRDRTAAPILIRSPVPAPAGTITFLVTMQSVTLSRHESKRSPVSSSRLFPVVMKLFPTRHHRFSGLVRFAQYRPRGDERRSNKEIRQAKDEQVAHLHPPGGGWFWIWSDRAMTWVSAFDGGPHVSDRGRVGLGPHSAHHRDGHGYRMRFSLVRGTR
jgi:hypothetical protein